MLWSSNIRSYGNLAICLGAILFNNWILGTVLNWHLFISGGSVSEFSATTQPYHWLFRVLDITSGLLLSAAALSLYKSVKAASRRFILGAMGVLGLANIIDALLPLPCSGTVDRICSAPVRINIHRISLPDHIFSSVIIGICYVALPLAGLLYAKYFNVRRFRLISVAALSTTIIFFVLLISESLIGQNSLITHMAGYSQELQMIVLGSWFVYFTKALPEDT